MRAMTAHFSPWHVMKDARLHSTLFVTEACRKLDGGMARDVPAGLAAYLAQLEYRRL